MSEQIKRDEANFLFVKKIQTALKSVGFYSGQIDGWAGSKTEAAMLGLLNSIQSFSKPCGAALLARASQDIGIKEVPGSKSNPVIFEMIKFAASWLDPDDSVTAWCGCALGYWVHSIGGKPPKEWYRAKEWMNFGTEVSLKDIAPGDILVFRNHVTLFESWKGRTIAACLGGNQSNSVNIGNYDTAAPAFLGARRIG